MSGRLATTICCVATIMSPAVSAQLASARTDRAAPDESEVRRLLESPDTTQQAWGAYWAGRLLMADSADEVEQVAKRHLDDSGRTRRVALDVAVDALIELGAAPASGFVVELRRVLPAQALILLARLGQEANPTLLSMLADAEGYEWRAAANLLYGRKAPGFAASLLSPLTFTAHLDVSTRGDSGRREGAGFSFSVGDGAGGLAEGYPPWTGYALRDCGQPGQVLIAPGPKPVCYVRQRTAAGHVGFIPIHQPSGPSNEDRFEYLRQVYPTMNLFETRSIAWQSDVAVAREMTDLVRVVRAKYRTLLEVLVSGGWLTVAEAKALANPTIREVISDLRQQ